MGLLSQRINCPCNGLLMSGSSAHCLPFRILGLYVGFQPVYSVGIIKLFIVFLKLFVLLGLKSWGRSLVGKEDLSSIIQSS